MKTAFTTKQLLLGMVAVGSTVFGGYQVVQALSAEPAPVSTVDSTLTQVKTVAETEFPTVSTDPFQPMEIPIVIQQSQDEAVVTGPATSSAVSTPVIRPGNTAPVRGSIGELPSATPVEEASPVSESVKTRATLEFKGVIDAGESLAYISINGERARPFRLGTPISPTVTLTGISHSFVTLQVLDKEVRVRTGQEVELK